jgi:hypothetical protein
MPVFGLSPATYAAPSIHKHNIDWQERGAPLFSDGKWRTREPFRDRLQAAALAIPVVQEILLSRQ